MIFSDRGCAIGGYVWLPGAAEPTISIMMPTTDKPLLRDRYRVKGEQKNEIGGVRRNRPPLDLLLFTQKKINFGLQCFNTLL
jgi:hypothetical protein